MAEFDRAYEIIRRSGQLMDQNTTFERGRMCASVIRNYLPRRFQVDALLRRAGLKYKLIEGQAARALAYLVDDSVVVYINKVRGHALRHHQGTGYEPEMIAYTESFTVAHEVGHWILKMTTASPHGYAPVDARKIEAFCDAFAGWLIIPSLVNPKVRELATHDFLTDQLRSSVEGIGYYDNPFNRDVVTSAERYREYLTIPGISGDAIRALIGRPVTIACQGQERLFSLDTVE
jgi:hypothetical protein